MKQHIEKEAQRLASQNYDLEIQTEDAQEDGFLYLALNPELPGCMAQGVTLEDALQNLADARVDYIASLLEDGLDVPVPSTFSYSSTDCEKITVNEVIYKTYRSPSKNQLEISSGQKVSIHQIHPC